MSGDRIRIGGGALSAAIDPFGAELVSLTDARGRELMTNADPAFWPKHAPILFPVVGVTSGGVIRVDGREYPMPKHGFARDRRFAVAAQDAGSATFVLDADDATRAHYPFDFQLRITFAILAATLSITAEVVNREPVRPMPASFGFHPAFAWPLPYGMARAEHRVVFDRDEPDALRTIAPDGTIARDPAPSPLEDGRILALRDDLFVPDALVWDRVRSDAVTYGADGAPHLRIAFPDTPKLGIWTKPGAAFVCVEPWHGIADPHGYAGEYRDKPGVLEVAPGGTRAIVMTVTLED